MKDFLVQLKVFTLKQARSAIFGGILLFFLILTKYIDVESILHIYRYDFLFIIALLTQFILIATGLESKKEVAVIILFHIAAMIMEIWKTSPAVGSWAYPEPAVFAIGAVPLFTGFLYSAVGSYIARAWRINEFRFENIPTRAHLWFAGTLIYANFFTNAYMYDIRYFIFTYVIIIFWKTKLHARITDKIITIHPLIANALVAFFVWLAEQIGTYARAWIYPAQAAGWKPVSFHMFTSWYMLLIFSFVLITILYTDMFRKHTFRLAKRDF